MTKPSRTRERKARPCVACDRIQWLLDNNPHASAKDYVDAIREILAEERRPAKRKK